MGYVKYVELCPSYQCHGYYVTQELLGLPRENSPIRRSADADDAY